MPSSCRGQSDQETGCKSDVGEAWWGCTRGTLNEEQQNVKVSRQEAALCARVELLFLQQIHSGKGSRQYDLPLHLLKTTKAYFLVYNWLSCFKKYSLFPLSHPEPGSQMLQMKLPLLSLGEIC